MSVQQPTMASSGTSGLSDNSCLPEGTRLSATDSLRELRVSLQLDIRVWGIDASGKPFSQAAQTIEVSALGARLYSLVGVQVGAIVGIQYRDAKARFRVVWVGNPGSRQEGLVGVECVEPVKCIWMAVLQEAHKTSSVPNDAPVFVPVTPPDIAPSPAASLQGDWPARDRRRYPRFQCVGALHAKQAGTSFETIQKLTDISLGGCYGESMSPFDINTQLDIVLDVCGEHIPIRGLVRTCHPTVGNGIGFTHVAPEDWKKLIRAVQLLGADVAPDALEPDISNAIEALLSLLQKKGVPISRDEFLGELKIRMMAERKVPNQ